jgi:hypothetical protein
VPARLDQVRHRLGVVHPSCLPEGDMPAEQAAGPGDGESREPQAASATRIAGRQRRAVETGRPRHRQQMHHADPHLLLVLLRPVGGTGQRGGSHCQETERGEPPSSLLGPRPSVRPAPRIDALPTVENRGRQPRPERRLHQNRVQRVPEPDSVQPVSNLARRQLPRHPLAQLDETVKTFSLFKPADDAHGGPSARLPGSQTRAGTSGRLRRHRLIARLERSVD